MVQVQIGLNLRVASLTICFVLQRIGAPRPPPRIGLLPLLPRRLSGVVPLLIGRKCCPLHKNKAVL